MISLLCPTRNRPKNMMRLIDSIKWTAVLAVELVCYVDNDDDSYDWKGVHNQHLDLQKIIKGPRITMSDMWNRCAKHSTGNILMMMGDDCVFKTSGWDVLIESAYADCPDKILMVHGADGKNTDNFGCFPTIHRKWMETVGYFVPPVFTGDYADTWLNDVANLIGRRKYLPYMTEHLHPVWGKAKVDSTYQEKFDRDKTLNPSELYSSLEVGRKRDADLLRAVMHGD